MEKGNKLVSILDVLILIVIVVCLLLMSSCSDKAILRKAINRGLIDTTKVDSIKVMIKSKPDTTYVFNTVTEIVEELDTLLLDTCINEQNRSTINSRLKKRIQDVQKHCIKDTLYHNDRIKGITVKIWQDSTGTFGVEVTSKKVRIIPCPKGIEKLWYEDYRWYLLIIAILILIIILKK